MNLSQALFYGKSELFKLENPKLETEVILAEVLQKPRTFLKTHEAEKLTFLEKLKFFYFIQKRKKHVPIAYIFGYKTWNDLKIFVNRSTLIPRDETEILCQHFLKFPSSIPDFSETTTLLDVGTGSGCIAIWLKKNFPKASVTALDFSRKALKIAQKNAKFHQVNVDFLESDLLEKIPKNTHFDFIIANLPYVPELQKNLTMDLFYEPKNALFSGKDGLEHLRRFSAELRHKNISYQSLWLEFLPEQKNAISAIFNQKEVCFLKDVGGSVFFAVIKPKRDRG